MSNGLRVLTRSLVLTAGLLAGCEGGSPAAPDASAPPDAPRIEPIQSTLFRHLSGRFSSNAQSQTQPSYFDVRLTACRVDAPELGTHVLYVEQAIAGSAGMPYRQRVYVIERGMTDTQGVSRVLELTAPRTFVGACDEAAMRTVSLEETVDRPGCAVVMNWDGTQFDGGTVGSECLSDFRGATYVTSEVHITSEGLTSWDRGFDAMGMQVWGATEGPYQFDRVTPLPDAE